MHFATVCRLLECQIFLPLEGHLYRVRDTAEGGNRQFVVQDPDGYLLRFWQDMGERDAL